MTASPLPRPLSWQAVARAVAAAALLLPAGATAAGAQSPAAPERPVALELRADLLAARATTVHAGGAVLWPVGRSVRIGLQAGGGITDGDAPPGADAAVASGRAELVARFELDPYAERRWGLYGSAGGGVLVARGRPGRATIFTAVGIERRTGSRFAPALEIGLGGGVRVGLRVGG